MKQIRTGQAAVPIRPVKWRRSATWRMLPFWNVLASAEHPKFQGPNFPHGWKHLSTSFLDPGPPGYSSVMFRDLRPGPRAVLSHLIQMVQASTKYGIAWARRCCSCCSGCSGNACRAEDQLAGFMKLCQLAGWDLSACSVDSGALPVSQTRGRGIRRRRRSDQPRTSPVLWIRDMASAALPPLHSSEALFRMGLSEGCWAPSLDVRADRCRVSHGLGPSRPTLDHAWVSALGTSCPSLLSPL